MYRQTYQSAVYPYRTPAEWRGVPNGIGTGSLYNPYLITPPRIYAEEVVTNLKPFLFCEPANLANATVKVSIIAYENVIYYPGWLIAKLSWNGVSGELLGREETGNFAAVQLAWTASLTVDFDNAIWRNDIFGDIQRVAILAEGFQYLESVSHTLYGVAAIKLPLVDRSNNLIAMQAEAGSSVINVYNFTVGTYLRSFRVSGEPVAICPGDKYQAYILCSNGVLNIVNINTGQILGAALFPVQANTLSTSIAWDKTYRRLLAFDLTANGADGSSTSYVRGYYPVPIATRLTKPIPLKPPRKFKEVQLAARMTDDIGNPLSSGVVQCALACTPTGAATLTKSGAAPDSLGYATFKLVTAEIGTAEASLTAEV
jgi:hypothetical protein